MLDSSQEDGKNCEIPNEMRCNLFERRDRVHIKYKKIRANRPLLSTKTIRFVNIKAL